SVSRNRNFPSARAKHLLVCTKSARISQVMRQNGAIRPADRLALAANALIFNGSCPVCDWHASCYNSATHPPPRFHMAADNVLKLIKEKNIRYVDFRFADVRGVQQHITYPA